METINVYKKNEVYLKVECDRGMAMELSSYFEFEVPGASFIPSVRAKMWDGRIRLFNVNTMQIYVGLLEKLKKFAADRDYQVIAHDGLEDTIDIPINGLEKFLSDGKYKPRDYQLRAVAHAVRTAAAASDAGRRALVLVPEEEGERGKCSLADSVSTCM